MVKKQTGQQRFANSRIGSGNEDHFRLHDETVLTVDLLNDTGFFPYLSQGERQAELAPNVAQGKYSPWPGAFSC
jgi:hypothetical protein